MLDRVFDECIGIQEIFGREQAKIHAWNEPVQRAALAANGAAALHDFFKIALDFEGDLPAVTAAFV